MNTWVSLLRGINVGTTKQVKMEDLVPVYESLEMVNIRTYLRSGNVVFDSPERDPVKLSAILEDEITRTSGFPVKVLMRNREELREIVGSNPYLSGNPRDPARLYVTFLSDYPSSDRVDEVGTVDYDADQFIVRGKEVYLFCPDGYGRTRFSNTFFEKNLNLIATTRNWKTVTVLSAMANERNYR